jgi:hypothetical protein
MRLLIYNYNIMDYECIKNGEREIEIRNVNDVIKMKELTLV